MVGSLWRASQWTLPSGIHVSVESFGVWAEPHDLLLMDSKWLKRWNITSEFGLLAFFSFLHFFFATALLWAILWRGLHGKELREISSQ